MKNIGAITYPSSLSVGEAYHDVKPNAESYTQYFPLTQLQIEAAHRFGWTPEKIQSFQKLKIQSLALYHKITSQLLEHETSKKHPRYIRGGAGLVFGRTFQQWTQELISDNEGWEEQFICMYYFLDFGNRKYSQVEQEVELLRSFLFKVHAAHLFPDIVKESLPTFDALKEAKRKNPEFYKNYLNLSRQYYQSLENKQAITYIPYSWTDKHKHTLQKGERSDILLRVFPNIDIIPTVKKEINIGFLEEIYVLGGYVPDMIRSDPQTLYNFIIKYADYLDEDIEYFSPHIQFTQEKHGYIRSIIKQHKEKKILVPPESEQKISVQVSTPIQVHKILIENKNTEKIYIYPPEINKKGIEKSHQRKGSHLIKNWKIDDNRMLYISVRGSDDWQKYNRDDSISDDLYRSGTYTFCLSLENDEKPGYPIDEAGRVTYTVAEKVKPVSSVRQTQEVQKAIPVKVVALLDTPKSLESNPEEDRILDILLSLEEKKFKIVKNGNISILTLLLEDTSELVLNYDLATETMTSGGLSEIVLDGVRDDIGKIFQQHRQEEENRKKSEQEEINLRKERNIQEKKEKYAREQMLDLDHTIHHLTTYLDSIGLLENLGFMTIASLSDALSTYRSSTLDSYLGANILTDRGLSEFIKNFRINKNDTYVGSIKSENVGGELSLSFQRYGRTIFQLSTKKEAPFFSIENDLTMDPRVFSMRTQIALMIAILYGEAYKCKFTQKNTAPYKRFHDYTYLQNALTGSGDASDKKPEKTEMDNILMIYKRLERDEGKVIRDGQILTSQSLSTLRISDQVIVQDEHIKRCSSNEKSQSAFNKAQVEIRIKKHLIKHMIGSVHAKKVGIELDTLKNGMNLSFLQYISEWSQDQKNMFGSKENLPRPGAILEAYPNIVSDFLQFLIDTQQGFQYIPPVVRSASYYMKHFPELDQKADIENTDIQP